MLTWEHFAHTLDASLRAFGEPLRSILDEFVNARSLRHGGNSTTAVSGTPSQPLVSLAFFFVH
jgi:hypothetical protein